MHHVAEQRPDEHTDEIERAGQDLRSASTRQLVPKPPKVTLDSTGVVASWPGLAGGRGKRRIPLCTAMMQGLTYSITNNTYVDYSKFAMDDHFQSMQMSAPAQSPREYRAPNNAGNPGLKSRAMAAWVNVPEPMRVPKLCQQ